MRRIQGKECEENKLAKMLQGVLLLFQDGCYIPNDGVNFTTAGNSATPGDYGEMPTGSDMR